VLDKLKTLHQDRLLYAVFLYEDYWYTLQPVTCPTIRSRGDSDLMNEEATLACLLLSSPKTLYKQRGGFFVCSASCCIAMLKKKNTGSLEVGVQK
jgi:hypothetical protein